MTRYLVKSSLEHLFLYNMMKIDTTKLSGTSSLRHIFTRNSKSIVLASAEFVHTSDGIPSTPCVLPFFMELTASSNSCLVSSAFGYLLSGRVSKSTHIFSSSVDENLYPKNFCQLFVNSAGLFIRVTVLSLDVPVSKVSPRSPRTPRTPGVHMVLFL